MRHGQRQQIFWEIKKVLPLPKNWNVSWLNRVRAYGRILQMIKQYDCGRRYRKNKTSNII
jgi:hypothetical protein